MAQIPGTFLGKPLPKPNPEREEMEIGYRGHVIPIPTETMRTVYAHPPGKPEPIIYLYFLDANGDVGRIGLPRQAAEKFAHEIHDLLAENKPSKAPL